MILFFSKYKTIFVASNFCLIILYLFPGSLIGCFLYNDCGIQPQVTPNFFNISSNHYYAFFILSFLGFFSYWFSKNLIFIFIYLIILSILIEYLHYIVPNRTFQFEDLFGNLYGVISASILLILIKIYAKFK